MLVWIDLEMTGLDHRSDQIIEIASIVTDDDLTIVAEGPELVVGTSPTALAQMNAVVHDMHTKTGLLERAAGSTVTLSEAEEATFQFICSTVKAPNKTPLCGNSIGTDRRFLDQYMPKVEQCLSYRCVDVSSVRELAKRWQPKVAAEWKRRKKLQQAAGLTKHRALDDIRQSIDELRFYRDSWLHPISALGT